jgi:uncharacterized protein (TIGR00159 family)
VRWQSLVDFVVLAAAIDLLLRWSRRARALRLALTILALRIAALLARELSLLITSWVLDAATVVALLALLVVFQPELRRALMRLDPRGFANADDSTPTLALVALAAVALAKARSGALIVIVRRDAIGELITDGVPVDAAVSAELLESVFQKGSPIHDGAVVIRDQRLVRAGAVLPLAQHVDVPGEYGTRHRAGLGLMERSDALVVVVSEERGEVTVMCGGHVTRCVNVDDVLPALMRFASEPAADRASRWQWPDASRWRTAAASLALAALVWSLTFLVPGRAVREQTVPVEFVNVPAGLGIASQSSNTVDVWLRGSDFVFASVDPADLVVRCDLAAAHAGVNRIAVGPDALDVPLGLKLAGVSPRELTVRLSPAR